MVNYDYKLNNKLSDWFEVHIMTQKPPIGIISQKSFIIS